MIVLYNNPLINSPYIKYFAMTTKTTIIDAMNTHTDAKMAFTSPVHADRTPEAIEFYELLPNFYFVLGRGESLLKADFIDRFTRMYDTESSAADPKLKYFKKIANNTSFLSITRNRVEGHLQVNF